ncbi:uncharacterized protein [Anoplolepis gracilipes]|uniref:uncharacterized protein n=1 Tax=Anoplolepis gracilipes TaxID=354296 RepID=UPI003BA00C3E
MWPGTSVLIIINPLILLVYSLPTNIDWNDLQYDPDSVAQNENVLKLFLQLAVHTANRLMHLRNETDKDYDCNGRNDNLSPSITEAPVMQSLLQANPERPDESPNEIQNHSFIIDSEIKSNDQVLQENLDKDQTALHNSIQSQELYDPSSFQVTDVAPNSKAKRNLIPMLVQNVQSTASDIVKRNHDVHKPDTSQKAINLHTTSNSLNADEFSSNEQHSQNSTVNESENVQESAPVEVGQRFFGIDIAKNIPDMNIINDLHKNVNQLNQWSQNIQEQLDRNNGNDINEPADASEGNNKKTENNNLSENSKAENSDRQSVPISDEIIKPEAFENINGMRTNEQLNSKNLFQENKISEFSKEFAIEKPLNQLESHALQISSITEYQDKNSSNTQDLQDFANINRFNLEKPKELQNNLSTNIRMRRSIEHRNTRVDKFIKLE